MDELKPGAAEPEAMKTSGVLAEYATPEGLIAAAEKVAAAGYRKWDCFTPFPVHGLDDAMKIQATRLPWFVLACGLTGLALALGFQTWANGFDYPWNISGKPLISLPASIPVTFEGTVLFSAIGSFVGVLLFCQLPQLYHPTMRSAKFARATDDRFFLFIEARDRLFEAGKATSLLSGTHPESLETLEEPVHGSPQPGYFKPFTLMLFCLLSIPPLMLFNSRSQPSGDLPRIHIVQDMDKQPKFGPQMGVGENLFADGRAMRPPAVGVVARGEVKADSQLYEGKVDGKLAKGLPASLPASAALMERGRTMYNIQCSVCHGVAGDGKGTVAVRAQQLAEGTFIPPLAFHDDRLRNIEDGHLFEVITKGIRTMPGYGHKIVPEDRWAIILYVRALQLSQSASIDVVPADERAKIKPQ
ncbi:MAG TPA: quinol:electron acceptor oxidoreductase subunit ActD [Planctomycetia bacterium]|jgi:mono/diheme cytochrome c family protein|nr:quinol:electron acceptor oxidoreductase subunit ActD [Planctomycetia bacterium]